MITASGSWQPKLLLDNDKKNPPGREDFLVSIWNIL